MGSIKNLYKNSDGFTIESRLGEVKYFGRKLESAVKLYGLSETPDNDELLKVTEIIRDYISTSRFSGAIGYPVYPNDDYNDDIRSIATSILVDKQLLKTEESRKKYYESIVGRFQEADDDYTMDIMSR